MCMRCAYGPRPTLVYLYFVMYLIRLSKGIKSDLCVPLHNVNDERTGLMSVE